MKLGVATYSYLTGWRPNDALEFLEHCHKIGAGGIQAPINGDPAVIRERADEHGMWVEAMVTLPNGDETAAFEQDLKNAQAAGATALRAACLGTRRYETFPDLGSWRQHVAACHQSLAAAVPLLEKYKLPLGLENHKDWTTDEMVAVMKQYSSEYLGVCLDFGNNIALLDDPMYVIEQLAPYTVSTHFKNMAVQPFEEGFLLSEVPLGDGYIDLPRALAIVREARPHAQVSLESITRDPLRIPCLADRYWATFPDRTGLDLARTLRFVQENQSVKPLPRVSHLSHEELLALENQNVIDCLVYARQHLNL
jgi:sugar phosphate isomerase/epimerase